MNEWMENKTDKKLIAFIFDVVMVLNVSSYLIASVKKPKSIP